MKPYSASDDAKELMLKDADYSTPQDHYFNYITQRKQMFGDMQASLQDIRSAEEDQELEVIKGLYGTDEAMVAYIEKKKRENEKKVYEEELEQMDPRLASNLLRYQKASPEEQAAQQEMFELSHEELEAFYRMSDESLRAKLMMGGFKRNKQQQKTLDSLNINKLMDMASMKKRTVEYSADMGQQAPFDLRKEDIVKLEKKSPRKMAKDRKALDMSEKQRELEVQLLLAQDEASTADAAQLARASSVQAKDATKKDMAKLRRLRAKAHLKEREAAGEGGAELQSSVKISSAINSDVPQ